MSCLIREEISPLQHATPRDDMMLERHVKYDIRLHRTVLALSHRCFNATDVEFFNWSLHLRMRVKVIIMITNNQGY